MKNLCRLPLMIVLLTACGTPSVEDLVADPDLLADMASECASMAFKGESIDTEACHNVAEAQMKTIGSTKNMLNEQVKGTLQQFGQ